MLIHINGTTNDSGEYIAQLAYGITLKQPSSIALFDIKTSKLGSSVYMLCNICTQSAIDDRSVACLRRIDTTRNVFSLPYFIPVIANDLSRLVFRFETLDGKVPAFKIKFNCTLCLKEE